MIAYSQTLGLPGMDDAVLAAPALVDPAPYQIPELARLVRFEAITNGQQWRVGGVGVRSGQTGRAVGIIALKHSAGYEVVLRFADGKHDTFSPMTLFPVLEAACP